MLVRARFIVGALTTLVLIAGQSMAQERSPDDTERKSPRAEQKKDQPDQPRDVEGRQPPRDAQERRQPPAEQGRQQSGASGQLNQYIARLVIAENEAEVELAQLAVEKAQDPRLKDFAGKIVQEHQQLSDKLRQIARPGTGSRRIEDGQGRTGTNPQERQADRDTRPELDRATKQAEKEPAKAPPRTAEDRGQRKESPPRTAEERGQRKEVPETQERVERGFRGEPARVGAADINAEQLVQMLEMIRDKQTQTFKKGMADKEGAAFDKTFMGLHQIGHLAMLESLDVMKQHASGELKQTLEEAHKTTQDHLREAEELDQEIRGLEPQSERKRTLDANPKRRSP